MKPRYYLIAFAAITVLLSSCQKEKKDVIWDLAPTAIIIDVVDENGKNLLDPANPDNILETDITMTHNGRKYSRLDFVDAFKVTTKYLGPVAFNGLQTSHKDGHHVLVIGFFEQTDIIEESEYVIDWGDWSKDTIRYSQSFEWKYNKKENRDEPDGSCRIWHNGTEIKDAQREFLDNTNPQLKIVR